MRKFLALLFILFCFPFVFILMQSCYEYPSGGCEGFYDDYTPVFYDTLLLSDSNKALKYSTELSEIAFVNANQYRAVFKRSRSYYGYQRDMVEYVAADEERCINSGYNYINLEIKRDWWTCTDLPLVFDINWQVFSKGDNNFNKDSIQNSFDGESIRFSFYDLNSDFNIDLPFSLSSAEIHQSIEHIDTISLNGIFYQNIYHIFYKQKPALTNTIYIKGIYLKWGIGLIAFYYSDNEIWNLEI
jgi:hypothetical protein